MIGDDDGLLATAHEAIQSTAGSSWAAEWCGKGECTDLLEHISWEDSAIAAMVADNVSATFGEDGWCPSPCAWIDRIWLQYAEFPSSHDVPEYFIPAQHDSHDSHWLARWQSMADELPKAALRTAMRMTAPFRRYLEGMALLFKFGTLVVHVTKGLDQCAVDRCMPIVPRMAHLAGMTWQEAVVAGNIAISRMAAAFWLRTALWCHVFDKDEFHCSICRRSYNGWGRHLTQSCVHAAMACMMGFAAVAESLQDQGNEVQWTSVTTLRVGEAELWRLQHEDDFRKTQQISEGTVMVSWSSLLANASEKLEVKRKLTEAYLNAMADFITLSPGKRLHDFLPMQPARWTATRRWGTLTMGYAIQHAAGGRSERVWGPEAHEMAHPLDESAPIRRTGMMAARAPPPKNQWDAQSVIIMDTPPVTSEYDIGVIRLGDTHGLYIGYKPQCMSAELMEVIKELRLSEWADLEVHPLHPLNWEDDSDDGDYEPKCEEESRTTKMKMMTPKAWKKMWNRRMRTTKETLTHPTHPTHTATPHTCIHMCTHTNVNPSGRTPIAFWGCEAKMRNRVTPHETTRSRTALR